MREALEVFAEQYVLNKQNGSDTEIFRVNLAKHLQVMGDQGLIRTVNFDMTARVFYGALDQYVMSEIDGASSSQSRSSSKELINGCITIFVEGLLSDG